MTNKPTAEARTAQSCGHTPGPWRIQADPEFAHLHPYHDCRFITTDHEFGSFSEHNGWVFDHPAGCVICDMRDGEHQQANARLIAAAPDLLEALKWVVSAMWQHFEYHHDGDDDCGSDNPQRAMDHARLAIAKAEGRRE